MVSGIPKVQLFQTQGGCLISPGFLCPQDLAHAACRWSDADLKNWISEPGRLRPGTAMPPLNRLLPAEERREAIEQIVRYLSALRADNPAACSVNALKTLR